MNELIVIKNKISINFFKIWVKDLSHYKTVKLKCNQKIRMKIKIKQIINLNCKIKIKIKITLNSKNNNKIHYKTIIVN